MNNKSQTKIIALTLLILIIGIIAVTYSVSPNLISSEIANEDHTFTPTSDQICINGKCNLIVYSGVRNIYEDDKWKRVENAKSLMPLYNNSFYTKDDIKGNKIRVLDFNMTDAHICVKSGNTGDVSFKIYKMGEVFNETWGEYFNERIYSEESIISITSKNTDHCFWVHTNILQNTIVFGDEIDKKEGHK